MVKKSTAHPPRSLAPANAIPDQTSAESFEHYVGGTCVRASRGSAWRTLKAYIYQPERNMDLLVLPAVSEPFLAWTFSGDVEFQERENARHPWITHRLAPGSFFLTSGGAPYQCRWRSLSDTPFQTMYVFLELPVLEEALNEIFGAAADHARLRDLSAFTDPMLSSMMECLRAELMRRKASPLFIHGLAHAIAIHLARNYAEKAELGQSGSPSLPGFKLKQMTEWMAEHLAEPFSLERLAANARLSKFHFHRLFKSATGVAPAQYHTNLRMDAARRKLRESDQSILAIALELGFANPSHFAQAFRREMKLSPSEYRRER